MGQKWHDEIVDGIRECKVFIVVVSPDSVESKYVQEEVNKALELGKTIFPVIYRPTNWDGEFASLAQNVSILDLHPERYAENFPTLVNRLIDEESAITVEHRPLLRPPVTVTTREVFGKVVGWAFFWSVGWLAFWLIVVTVLIVIQIALRQMDATEARNLVTLLLSGGVGGFVGGLLAGLLTMLALRSNAPSILWEHMEPTIRIWSFTGPIGALVVGVITTVLVAAGVISTQSINIDCDGLSLSQCLGTGIDGAMGQVLATALTIAGVFMLLVLVIWFFTGVFAGWQAVRHIRRLEPGITSRQGRSVTVGWGCGSIVAAGVMIAVFGVILDIMGL
jgi:hypothetical protein